jgi:hypothetical protein
VGWDAGRVGDVPYRMNSLRRLGGSRPAAPALPGLAAWAIDFAARMFPSSAPTCVVTPASLTGPARVPRGPARPPILRAGDAACLGLAAAALLLARPLRLGTVIEKERLG